MAEAESYIVDEAILCTCAEPGNIFSGEGFNRNIQIGETAGSC